MAERLIDVNRAIQCLQMDKDRVDKFPEDSIALIRSAFYAAMIERLKSEPTAQPTAQERPVGHWIEADDVTIRCTGCEAEFDSNLFEMPMSRHAYIRYCPYCGAEMRGEA